jgi:hypothetical protein
VLGGLVAPAEAFLGFGHPAVITVACVLVLSRGLQNAGAVDALTRRVLPAGAGRLVSLASLMGLGVYRAAATADPFDALTDVYPSEALEEMAALYASRKLVAA